MLYYLCIGFGVFISIYAVNLADEKADLGFFEGIFAFIMTLCFWPLNLLINGGNALLVRAERKETEAIFEQLLSQAQRLEESSLDAPECPTTQKDEVDKGNGST